VPALIELARMCREAGLSIMSYSGYTLEELEGRHDPATDELLGMLDVLVDGRYDEKLRNLTLIYCGSENQRVIDMRKTRNARLAGDDGIVIPYKSSFDVEIEI
jgi:anaerobic ribonucleoside-triphosphate reductase activating protein